jgi:hypothetical protein
VRVAVELDQLGVRDERCEVLAGLEADRPVAAAVHDEHGRVETRRELADVRVPDQLHEGGGHRRLGGAPLKRRERVAVARIGARDEQVGEHPAAEAPVGADEVDGRAAHIARAEVGPVRVRPVEDEPVDALRVTGRVGDRRRAAAGRAEHGDTVELELVQKRAEQVGLVVDRHRLGRPLALREPAAEPVVADHAPGAPERLHEAAEVVALPVLRKIRDPPRGKDEGRALADGGVGDAPAAVVEEAGLLGGHLPQYERP